MCKLQDGRHPEEGTNRLNKKKSYRPVFHHSRRNSQKLPWNMVSPDSAEGLLFLSKVLGRYGTPTSLLQLLLSRMLFTKLLVSLLPTYRSRESSNLMTTKYSVGGLWCGEKKQFLNNWIICGSKSTCKLRGNLNLYLVIVLV